MARTEAALRVEGVTVKYGEFTALKELSFEAYDGQIVGLIGPNGAGKSSSFAAIANTIKKSSGSVHLYGDDVSGKTTQVLSKSGLRRTFQENSFFSDLTVLENTTASFQVADGSPLWESTLMPWRERKRREASRRSAKELLLKFGIEEKYHDSRPDDLPHGLQRVLSIVVAYGAGIKVLLVDEPGAGIGGQDMKNLAQLLGRLRDEGLAIILIEHHMDLVMDICDRIIVIDQGDTIAYGNPADVQRDPRVLEAYLGKAA